MVDLPLDTEPLTFALLSHCFTCSKNFKIIANISRALTRSGIAARGSAQIQGFDRSYTIKRQFVEDLPAFLLDAAISNLGKSPPSLPFP